MSNNSDDNRISKSDYPFAKKRSEDPIPGVELRGGESEHRGTSAGPLIFAGVFVALGVAFIRHNLKAGKGGSRSTMEARVAAQGLVVGALGIGAAISAFASGGSSHAAAALPTAPLTAAMARRPLYSSANWQPIRSNIGAVAKKE